MISIILVIFLHTGSVSLFAETSLTDESNVISEISPEQFVPSTRFRPAFTVRMPRNGFQFSIGPKLVIKHNISRDRTLSGTIQYLPLKFEFPDQGERLDYSVTTMTFTRRITDRWIYDVGLALHHFRPDRELESYLILQGGSAVERVVPSANISLARRILRFSFRWGKKRWKIPVFLKVSYSYCEGYDYGTNLGTAGTEFKLRSGFSFSLRPMIKRF